MCSMLNALDYIVTTFARGFGIGVGATVSALTVATILWAALGTPPPSRIIPAIVAGLDAFQSALEDK